MAALGAGVGGGDAWANEATLSEDFASLERWEEWVFKSVPNRSQYRVEAREQGEGSYLLMESDNAGSGLVSVEAFDVFESPVLQWRWKVEQAIEGLDLSKRSGDDYPARVYVIFEYDGTGLSLAARLRYRAYRALRGEYPPHSTLCYVWTGSEAQPPIFRSPYSKRARMLVLRGPGAPLGEWRDEQVHILEDYRKAFGKEPPRTPARIALMSDSNDSGASTRAALDFIRLSRE